MPAPHSSLHYLTRTPAHAANDDATSQTQLPQSTVATSPRPSPHAYSSHDEKSLAHSNHPHTHRNYNAASLPDTFALAAPIPMYEGVIIQVEQNVVAQTERRNMMA